MMEVSVSFRTSIIFDSAAGEIMIANGHLSAVEYSIVEVTRAFVEEHILVLLKVLWQIEASLLFLITQ